MRNLKGFNTSFSKNLNTIYIAKNINPKEFTFDWANDILGGIHPYSILSCTCDGITITNIWYGQEECLVEFTHKWIKPSIVKFKQA